MPIAAIRAKLPLAALAAFLCAAFPAASLRAQTGEPVYVPLSISNDVFTQSDSSAAQTTAPAPESAAPAVENTVAAPAPAPEPAQQFIPSQSSSLTNSSSGGSEYVPLSIAPLSVTQSSGPSIAQIAPTPEPITPEPAPTPAPAPAPTYTPPPAAPTPAPAANTFARAPAAPITTAPVAPSDTMDLRFANGIIAVVEDKPITVDDVRREIGPIVPQLQREATSQQDFENKLQAIQDEIVQNHIDRTLIVKEFYKEKDGEPKKSIPASYIDNQLSEEIINRFDNDRSKFLAFLRSQGKTIREYRKELEEEMINGYMRQQQRKSQSVVSPVKVETFYRENKDKFFQDDQVHLRLIQFTRNGETDAQLRLRSDEVSNRMRNGEKFEDIAKEISQDTRRSKGGDWGWQKRGDLKAELSDPLFKLGKGQVTEPILMPEGAFLMYVEDRKYAGIQPIEEVRDQIERIILQQMARTSQEQWLERLRRNGYVKYFN